ncbi:MAG: hypothetical protein KY455_07880 [Euryarchaeota archaeon]|nr:hypothetical protein [Euryarchaeota archaeon]
MRGTSYRPSLTVIALALAATIVLSGCTGSNLGVSNNPGAFSLGGQVANMDETKDYDWENPSLKARVDFGGQSSGGAFNVNIKDSTGKQVYSHSFSSENDGTGGLSSSGTPGTWKIVIEFRDFTGNVGLSINSA